MSIIVFNPTNEEFKATFGGVNIIIPKFGDPGCKVKMEDARAKHLLNSLGPRGLTILEYGDEGEIELKKSEDGRARNLDFKRKQVTKYNQDNEARKAQKLGYVDPPKHIQEYAKELGTGIIAPYQMQDIKNEEIAKLQKEKAASDKALKDVLQQFNAVTALLQQKGFLTTPEEKEEMEVDAMMQEYRMMKPDKFKPWVLGLGFDVYSQKPIAVQLDITSKWGRFFEDVKKDPFPY